MSDETSFGEEMAKLVADGETSREESAPESLPEKEATEQAPSQEGEATAEAEKPEAETPAQTKDVPFHKHPRWIRQQQEKEELRAKLEALEAKLNTQSQPKEEVKQQAMPEAFTKLFGSNEEAWTEWQKLGLMTKSEVEAMTKSMIQQSREEETAKERQAQEANQKALQWAEDQFITLSDETGIDFTAGTERNQILDIIEKYDLYTTDGLPNIVKANELRAVLYPPSTQAVEEKRKVAAKTGVKTNAGTKESDIITPQKLREMEKRGGISQFFK